MYKYCCALYRLYTGKQLFYSGQSEDVRIGMTRSVPGCATLRSSKTKQ